MSTRAAIYARFSTDNSAMPEATLLLTLAQDPEHYRNRLDSDQNQNRDLDGFADVLPSLLSAVLFP